MCPCAFCNIAGHTLPSKASPLEHFIMHTKGKLTSFSFPITKLQDTLVQLEPDYLPPQIFRIYLKLVTTDE